ncbi:VOC family protein [Marinivivus vitaminiproducens]|uniref:VOC family protein n=1 Tax=Marinivivus vitaminiproducens TaxID=3035935 RepID=UPI0027A3E072|nr:VOC family protein [Geminicoccaceae bacterium SCSIO 64248]
MRGHLAGMDHVVVLARALDQAARAWHDLGFTLSPRGVHSAHIGSANHTIPLGADYIELLGILTPTDVNRNARAFLDRREGLERIALRTDDAAAGVQALQAAGLAVTGPLAFGRPVDLPGGLTGEARFRTFHWPPGLAPAGVGLFACQHLTPEAVWVPEWQRHTNGAQGLDHVGVLAADPHAAGKRCAELTGLVAEVEEPGVVSVATGPGRGTIRFLDTDGFARRYPGLALADPGEEGARVLCVRVADLALAGRHAPPDSVRGPGTITVLPTHANGVAVRFIEA